MYGLEKTPYTIAPYRTKISEVVAVVLKRLTISRNCENFLAERTKIIEIRAKYLSKLNYRILSHITSKVEVLKLIRSQSYYFPKNLRRLSKFNFFLLFPTFTKVSRGWSRM